jgi:hypothetical protein
LEQQGEHESRRKIDVGLGCEQKRVRYREAEYDAKARRREGAKAEKVRRTGAET